MPQLSPHSLLLLVFTFLTLYTMLTLTSTIHTNKIVNETSSPFPSQVIIYMFYSGSHMRSF